METPPTYVPRSKLAETLLLSSRFTPFSSGYLVAETIVGDEDASVEEIDQALQGFEQDGLVVGQTLKSVRGRAYAPERKGWEVRERLLAERGMRHQGLVSQREHALCDLLLAIVVSPHLCNARMSGSFLAAESKVTFIELQVYLYAYTTQELRAGINALVEQGKLTKTTRYGSSDEAFEITGRGRQEYRSGASRRLRLVGDQSILDVIIQAYIDVFDAWQSECKSSRRIIDTVLTEVVDAFNATGRLARPLRVVRATEPGDGAIRIDVALQEKIARADFFVGDLTPVYAYGNRLRVNENVLVEVGFALASMEPNQVILLAMKRDDVPGDPTNAKHAFDIAHVRRHEFNTKDELRWKLRTELEAALQALGWLS